MTDQFGVIRQVAYVVDSNCFIHMGGMASTTILNDLKSALGTMHVTKGVHGAVSYTHLTLPTNREV